MENKPVIFLIGFALLLLIGACTYYYTKHENYKSVAKKKKEHYIAPNMGPIPPMDPTVERFDTSITQSAVDSNGSPFLEGVFRTIGTGENTNFNAPSDSLMIAQDAAKHHAGGPGLIPYMDLTFHNLAPVKGMNL